VTLNNFLHGDVFNDDDVNDDDFNDDDAHDDDANDDVINSIPFYGIIHLLLFDISFFYLLTMLILR
jgi:hypothetical protein